tara:strand:- start:1193 stop:1834 length:642 start_codon:yes stop_codon:yes gene_type:complete
VTELKTRIFTSALLFLVLYFVLINNIILLIVLLYIFYLSFIEFNNIFKKIFKNNKLFHFFLILIFSLYLVFFSLIIYLYLTLEFNNNKIIFLFLLSVSISTDIGGYCFGKIFKGKKLTKISPNKTYSGVIGSIGLSILVAFIFFKNLDLNYNYLIITILLSFISQFGDLFVSYLKRKAKIKNTGSLLPGHGGILDRIDGVLFVLPFGIILINI